MRPIGRRQFVIVTAAGLGAAGLGAWLWQRSRGSAPVRASAEEPSWTAIEGGVFPQEALPLLAILASAIVPRDGRHPGAGEIALLAGLETVIDESPDGADFFREHWPALARAVRERVPHRGGAPVPARLEAQLLAWHLEYEVEDAPSVPASVFEGLRRNVLLAYYSTAAGWASVGYPGPVHAELRHRPAHG
jgi:hypothetical protein